MWRDKEEGSLTNCSGSDRQRGKFWFFIGPVGCASESIVLSHSLPSSIKHTSITLRIFHASLTGRDEFDRDGSSGGRLQRVRDAELLFLILASCSMGDETVRAWPVRKTPGLHKVGGVL